MACWLVVADVMHPELAPGQPLRFERRVFGDCAAAAFELVAALLAAHGWVGALDVSGPVSAAQPHAAPLLRPLTDFYQLDRLAGSLRASARRTTPDTSGRAFVAPASPQTPSRRPVASRLPVSVPRKLLHQLGRTDGHETDSWVPAAICGWGIDRRCSSQQRELEPPHRDPLHVNERWPDVLAFGPDVLACEEQHDDDADAARSGRPGFWHNDGARTC